MGADSTPRREDAKALRKDSSLASLHLCVLAFSSSTIRHTPAPPRVRPSGQKKGLGARDQGPGEETSSLEPSPAAVGGQPLAVVAVAAGDTLYGISRQYGVDWAQVAEANGLATPNQLYPGQLLKIPPDVPGPTPEFNHRVHNGETLSSLARQYGLSADELAAANGLSTPYTIYSGQMLVIPSDEE